MVELLIYYLNSLTFEDSSHAPQISPFISNKRRKKFSESDSSIDSRVGASIYSWEFGLVLYETNLIRETDRKDKETTVEDEE